MKTYSVGGLEIYADDDRFIREVLIENEYGHLLFSYDTVVDVGANIGTFSFWIYDKARRIYAVEPNPKAINLLRQTVSKNSLDKIIAIEGAITGSDGQRLLKNTDDLQYGAGTINDDEGISVKAMRLDTFMIKNSIDYIDLLKIDIEGCEQEVFASDGFRNVANKISTIIGEYHTGSIGQAIGASLTGCGFRFVDMTRANSSGKFIARRL